MKLTKMITLVMALLLLTLSACSSETPDQNTTAIPPLSSPATIDPATPPVTVDPATPPASTPSPATEPTATPPVEQVPAPPTTDPLSEEKIPVQKTPVSLTERPEFTPGDRVREEELISLHGYAIGMTFAETQQVWEIPKPMIDYVYFG